MPDLTLIIPGLREAIEQEQLERNAAFLDVPETLCGHPVPAMTLQHLIVLSCIGSPFVDGGPVDRAHVRQFLLVITGATGWRKRWLLWRTRKLDLSTALPQIKAYLDSALADIGGGSGAAEKSYYSFAAGLVDMFLKEYQWPEAKTLNYPLKKLLQFRNVIARRYNPSATLFNPSDKVCRLWLLEKNRSITPAQN